MMAVALGLIVVFAVGGMLLSVLSLVRSVVKARDEEWKRYIEARYGRTAKERRDDGKR